VYSTWHCPSGKADEMRERGNNRKASQGTAEEGERLLTHYEHASPPLHYLVLPHIDCQPPSLSGLLYIIKVTLRLFRIALIWAENLICWSNNWKCSREIYKNPTAFLWRNENWKSVSSKLFNIWFYTSR